MGMSERSLLVNQYLYPCSYYAMKINERAFPRKKLLKSNSLLDKNEFPGSSGVLFSHFKVTLEVMMRIKLFDLRGPDSAHRPRES